MTTDSEKRVEIEEGKCYEITSLVDHSIIWLKCTDYSFMTKRIRGYVLIFGVVSDIVCNVYNIPGRYKITEIERKKI
jgi:hypothetical protein